jgi:hypothetical protein
MKKSNASVLQGLLDSKKEYVEHLCDVFAEPMIACFQRVYQECINKPEARSKGVLAVFQDQLGVIPSWNQTLIQEEFAAAKDRSGCTYITDLIRAILITYVKIAIVSNHSTLDSDSVKLRVPAGENFYHRCLVICARELWKQPYLLYHKVRSIELQQNMIEIESLARKAIRSAIRMYIPMDQLITSIQLQMPKEPVQSDDEETETESESTESEEEETETIQEEEEEPQEESESEEEPQEESETEEEPQEESETEEEDQPKPEIVEEPEPEIVVQESEEEVVHESDSETGSRLEVIPVDERKSVDIDPDLHVHDHDDDIVSLRKTTEDVPVVTEENEVVNEPSKKKILFGSMLLNKDHMRKHKLKHLKVKKTDSFF